MSHELQPPNDSYRHRDDREYYKSIGNTDRQKYSYTNSMILGSSNDRGSVFVAILAVMMAIAIITTIIPHDTNDGKNTKTWDDSVLKELAQSYRQRSLLLQAHMTFKY